MIRIPSRLLPCRVCFDGDDIEDDDDGEGKLVATPLSWLVLKIGEPVTVILGLSTIVDELDFFTILPTMAPTRSPIDL